MNKVELLATKNWLKQTLEKMPSPKCENCEHHNRISICSLFDEVPPAEIQAAGCDEWVYDGVPF